MNDSCRADFSLSFCETGSAALAELLALAERQVAELSRPLSDRKAETVTDRLWPVV